MFSKPLSPFQEPKTNKRVFKSEPEVLPCFELNYKFLERHKKPFARDNEKAKKLCERGAENGKQSSTKQDREATTEEVPGSIVTYTEEENTLKDMSTENTKKSTSTSVRRLQSWYLEKYKTELNLNSIDLASYLLTQWQFWQLTLKWLSGARAQDKTKQYYCCFLFFLFYSIMRFKENSLPDSWIPR